MVKVDTGMERSENGQYKVSIDGKVLDKQFDTCTEAAAFMEGILWGWEDAAEHS